MNHHRSNHRLHRNRRGLVTISLLEVLMCILAVFAISIAIPFVDSSADLKSSSTSINRSLPILRLTVASHGQHLWVQRGVSDIVTMDLSTHKTKMIYKGNGRPIVRSCLSKDSLAFILSIDDSEVVICRDQELLAYESLSPPTPVALAISSDGYTAVRIVKGTEGRSWDLSSDECSSSPFVLGERVEKIALSPQGNYFVGSTSLGTIHVYEARTGTKVQTLPETGSLTADPVFSEDGRWLAVVRPQSVCVYDMRSSEVAWTYLASELGDFISVAISPDGEWVAAGGATVKIHLFQRANGEIVWKKDCESATARLAFASTNDTLYGGSFDGGIRIWSVKTGSLLKTIELQPPHEPLVKSRKLKSE